MPRFIASKFIRDPLTIKEFHEKRKKVLIIREWGGLGDILMHRMMFEDFHRVMPDIKVVFACPSRYHQALYDHPYIHELLDVKNVKCLDYVLHYTTSNACSTYESKLAPYSDKHRSDIWANHCGVELQNHNMHIHLEETYKIAAKARLSKKNRPCVALAPVSAMAVKNLLDWQLEVVVKHLHKLGCFVYAVHNKPIPFLESLGVPVWLDAPIRQWMAALHVADYVVSVDTAAFHYAGGIGKPLTGIFTSFDGKTYGKYFDFALVQKHRDNGDWNCGPCYNWTACPKCKSVPKPCLTEITSEMLTSGIDEMFRKWPLVKNYEETR